MLDDIQFSKNSIEFPKEKKFTLEITNKSSTQSYVFKIKTTKLNTYQVKPPLGSIQPGEQKNVQFKIIVPLTREQAYQSTSKDKFQFQFLSGPPNSTPKTKQQFKTFWDQAKNDPAQEANILNFTFPIQIFDQSFQTVNTEPFSPMRTNNFTAKSDFKSASVKKSFTLQGQFNKPQKSDQQLSNQFQKLKQKQEKLLVERQSIYKQQPRAVTQKSSKSGVQTALVIIAFLMSIVIGNFLKLRVFVEEQPL